MDERLRELERRWLLTREVADEAAYLAERMRAGRIASSWVDLAARLGDPAARRVKGLPELPPLEGSSEALRILGRLADTIAWLESRQGATDGLRSEVLGAPFRRHLERSLGDPMPIDLVAEKLERWANGVVCARRAEALDREGWLSHVRARDLAGGRLLVFAPEENLFDGAADLASGGLFDVANLPAWDTWVQLVREPARTYLLCWLPAQAVPAAEAGIWANPEKCIEWADASSYRIEELPLLREVLARCAP